MKIYIMNRVIAGGDMSNGSRNSLFWSSTAGETSSVNKILQAGA
jgi:hypothetical protein